MFISSQFVQHFDHCNDWVAEKHLDGHGQLGLAMTVVVLGVGVKIGRHCERSEAIQTHVSLISIRVACQSVCGLGKPFMSTYAMPRYDQSNSEFPNGF